MEPRSLSLESLSLSVLRVRMTLRMLADAQLPAAKGPMLRGAFGYAFQRASCPPACWGQSRDCPAGGLCAYRWIFETPRPPVVGQLHDLQDVPRPFVIEPPADTRCDYRAGETLECVLVLVGRAIDYLPYALFSFDQLGRAGLGSRRAPARLERTEALLPWQPVGPVIYQDGRLLAEQPGLPLVDAQAIIARAAGLPADLRLDLLTPLRLKADSAVLRGFDLPALVRAACWRLNALAIFHGGGAWPADHAALAAMAASVEVAGAQVRWQDQARVSRRGQEPNQMQMGGLVGTAMLRGVPPELRALLLAASLVHVGKACVFGQGGLSIRA